VLTALQITEKEWQRLVTDLATTLGWFVFHPWLSVHSQRGWPDLSLLRERAVFAELKAERGKLSVAQAEVLDLLRACGQECYVWRPSDWEQVKQTLAPIGVRVR
jgi:hypothetical protein